MYMHTYILSTTSQCSHQVVIPVTIIKHRHHQHRTQTTVHGHNNTDTRMKSEDMYMY